jgi:hypothetical protein
MDLGSILVGQEIVLSSTESRPDPGAHPASYPVDSMGPRPGDIAAVA